MRKPLLTRIPSLLHVLRRESSRHREAIHPTARLHHLHLHPGVLHHRPASPQSPRRLSMATCRFLLTSITTSSRAQNLPLNDGCIHDRGTRIGSTLPCLVVDSTFGGLCLRLVGVDDLLGLRLGENLRSHLHEFVQPDGLAAFTDDSWFSVTRRHSRIGARRPVSICSANITE